MDRKLIDVAGGEIEYADTGGDGRPVVFLHGALMDEHLWAPVVSRLRQDLRCIIPVLPLGAHRHPRPSDADQSPAGLARLVGEFIRALGLRDVTLVGNDTGGAIVQLLVADEPDVAARVALVSCDAFDNFPPGLPGRTMAWACAVPGGLRMSIASLRLSPLRRLPMTFGWMTKRPIDPAVFRGWLDAFAADGRVRRDVTRMMRGIDRHQLGAAAARFNAFEGEALVVWATEDRVMPVEHAHRLASAFRSAHVEFVDDSYTLMPLDRPARLAELIEEFALAPARGQGE